ncbi:solute carrier family 40 member 2-like [Rhodamnia argentea]|uniref:Solute carrier family 40 member n=1 Tax=Rhodamnia argentea TaxID=178133 RepID=A0ABM3HZF2_9MYRT|nr:solute carrier family 40 member 2-like [Rhodamnia argentea]
MTREPLPDHEASSPQPSFPSHLTNYLYLGYFLARWGTRMWDFSVALYMINIWPDSLLLAAVYGVVENASTALFGPIIGKWVDKLSYIKVLRLWLVTQNFSFIAAGGTVLGLLAYPDLKSTSVETFVLLVLVTNVSGAVGVLSTLAGTILIEREWVVVMSEGQAPKLLTQMNSVIRRIDLICKLFAPVVSGFIISFGSLKASAMTLAVFSTISVWLEYWLFMSAYKGSPALAERNRQRTQKPFPAELTESSSVPDDYHPANAEKSQKRSLGEKIANLPLVSAWRVYFEQEVVLPGIALALLYFTVLSFGSLMTATLEWEGIPAFVIGIARGISATIGVAATLVYPVLQSRISTIRTGLWSSWSQWTFLLLCVGSKWVRNNIVAASMLMGGVAASRLGLWMFDLAVIQQMQDKVPESDRCVVGGAQSSLQSLLYMMAYGMGIIISNPKDFWQLILLSFLSVTLSASLYTLHVYRVRKHLIHFEKLILLGSWSIIWSSDAHQSQTA